MVPLTEEQKKFIEKNAKELRSRIYTLLRRSNMLKIMDTPRNSTDTAFSYVVEIINDYDPKRGPSFVRWAAKQCIRTYISAYSKDLMCDVRHRRRLEEVAGELFQELERPPYPGEILARMVKKFKLDKAWVKRDMVKLKILYADPINTRRTQQEVGVNKDHNDWKDTEKRLLENATYALSKGQLSQVHVDLLRANFLPKATDGRPIKTMREIGIDHGFTESRTSQIAGDGKLQKLVAETLGVIR